MSEGGLGASIARLEVILDRLEHEDLELEVALALFEEGVGHVREAERLLRAAELKVEQLLDRGGMEALQAPGEGP
jgi:exodeoxyribonuclease VII small subunit